MSISTSNLTRRQFTQAAAAGAVALGIASNAGAALADTASEPANTECDVLVIGAGGSGMAAAATAAQEGASVIVLEKGDSQMGSSVLALGTFYGAGTELQKAAGIDDEPSALLDYFLSCNGDKLAYNIQKWAAENYGQTIDWLTGDLQVPFKDTVSLKGKDTVERGHNCANTAADALSAVTDLAVSNGADLRFGIQATELVMDESGAVTGVKATDAEGNELTCTA